MGCCLMNRPETDQIYDVFVIGGGINGCGIARDAAGRGLSVMLAEMHDLGSATSSASTKLFHGGLRYLEYFEIGLVRKALIERETLLAAMPHISWPMRFVLPYHKDMRFEGDTPASKIMNFVMPWTKGRRPAWVIRFGLFLYDHLGGRKILPGTTSVDLTRDPVGAPLKDHLKKAFEYSDCWVEDSRLVVLNARDAQTRGARILTRTKVISATGSDAGWSITLQNQATGDQETVSAKTLVNAAGPWVDDVIVKASKKNLAQNIRLVRGSHIVTKKLFDHDKCYFFQGQDGRIIFAIPYETDFTLIGTTDADHDDPSHKPTCTPQEAEYLCKFASEYFKKPVSPNDIVWTYSGVRALFNDGEESASATTRDYMIRTDTDSGAPLLNVFGGKITTYRKLAESTLAKIKPFHNNLSDDWTAGVALPGGDFPVDGVGALIHKLSGDYPFLDAFHAKRMIRAYGTDAWSVLGAATSGDDLGIEFGAGLNASEIKWLMENEFARTGEDVVWRRSKLGLRMSQDEIETLDVWMKSR